jgi:hypothetical protein
MAFREKEKNGPQYVCLRNKLNNIYVLFVSHENFGKELKILKRIFTFIGKIFLYFKLL